MRKKIWKPIVVLVKVALAVFITYYLFRSEWLTKEALTKLFKAENFLFVILSGSFYLVAQILCTSRLVLLLRTIDFPLPFLKVFKLVMIGNAFNAVIPGIIGGDFIKSVYLMKSEEEKRGQSAGIVLMDRTLGFLTLVWIGGISLIYLLSQNGKVSYKFHDEIYFAIGGVVCISVVSLALFIFGRNKWIRLKIASFFNAFFKRNVFYYVLDGFAALLKHRMILIYSLLVSLLIQFTSLSGLLILGNLISAEPLPDVITLAGVSAVVILVNTIPITPGNLGWTEFVAALCWAAVGSNAGAAIFLNWRIVTIICSLPWGLMFFLITDWRKARLRNHRKTI